MRYLYALVFSSGAVTLGMELSASRLIEPVFGNNQIIWAALIGLILLYLALGAWLGGVLADRYPERRALDYTLTAAAVGVALVPLLSRPALRLAGELSSLTPGLLGGALLAVLLLLSIPGILLGTASPWAVRLAVGDIAVTGHTVGRLYAVGTAGSLLGAFVPVLWLIPSFGTRWTFYILALFLLTVITLGSLRLPHRWIPLAALIGVAAVALLTQLGAPLTERSSERAGEVIYADESAYNTIVVRQWHNERHLRLNEGIGIHSVYHPDTLLSDGIWDYFLLAPLFQPSPIPDPNRYRMLLIGLAAGTVSELFTNIYGPVNITGVELDPQIIEVGRRYFNMVQPNLTAVAADGRNWLAQQPEDTRFDMIAVDAYRPPYIPFHLATVEFFQLVHDHLTPDGVLAINVGRTETNYSLIEALAATAGQVFPSVTLIDEPGPATTLANTLLVASMQPVAPADLAAVGASLPDTLPQEFRDFAASALATAHTAAPPPQTPVFTDDRAPVERVVHSIILDYLRGN